MAVKTKSDRGPAGTLTVDDLTRAIKNSIDRTGMKEEEARAMAQHVLNFFGYSERIIDNVLEPEDRDAFYMLEDSGILTTEREETTLYDGREWRIHYWMFRKERIAELVEAQKAKEEAEKMGSIYDDVPDDFWTSRNVLAASASARTALSVESPDTRSVIGSRRASASPGARTPAMRSRTARSNGCSSPSRVRHAGLASPSSRARLFFSTTSPAFSRPSSKAIHRSTRPGLSTEPSEAGLR